MGWKFFNSSGAERSARPASVVNPVCKISGSSGTFTYDSFTKATVLTTVDIDTDGMADTANSRIIIRHSGKYFITGGVMIDATNGTGAKVGVYKNGLDVGLRAASATVNYDTGWCPVVSGVIDLVAGDYLELYYYSNATPGVFVKGTHLSATKVDGALVSYVEVPKSFVGQELSYNQITSPVTINATSEGTANTIIVSNSVTFDGLTKIKLEFWCPSAVAGQIAMQVVVLRDTTVLGSARTTDNTSNYGDMADPLKIEFFDTPPSGSHTYTIKAWVNTGSATIGAGPGGASAAQLPAFLRVVRAA